MKRIPVALLAALVVGSAAPINEASAQVPPHAPGAVCITPQFWCWVNPPGQPGAACTCPSPYGAVAGTYG
jgi:hypothetical protein